MDYEFETRLPGQRATATGFATIARDGAGVPDVVRVTFYGPYAVNKGAKFGWVREHLRRSCWDDVLLQLDIESEQPTRRRPTELHVVSP